MKIDGQGFSIVEVMIGIGIVGIMATGAVSIQAHVEQMNRNEKATAHLASVKARILATIDSDAAWAKTVELSSTTSHLGCLGSSEGCASVSGSYDFDLYEADGSLVYSSTPTSGFDINGSSCTSSPGSADPCPIRLQLTWSPSCAASDTNCRYPLIQITGTFSSSMLHGSLNVSKSNFTINRSTAPSSLCPTTPPSCPGAIAVCTSSGWTCLSPLPPYCQGTVSWNDSVSGYGTCVATFAAPGILHDTIATATNDVVGISGSASFLCIPSEPNNGFVLQTGATCSSAPINGACGGANGGSFPDAVAANTAGLCSAGTPSPASLSGPAPWAWTCNGSSGGGTASCSAGNASTLYGYFKSPGAAGSAYSGSAVSWTLLVKPEPPPVSGDLCFDSTTYCASPYTVGLCAGKPPSQSYWVEGSTYFSCWNATYNVSSYLEKMSACTSLPFNSGSATMCNYSAGSTIGAVPLSTFGTSCPSTVSFCP